MILGFLDKININKLYSTKINNYQHYLPKISAKRFLFLFFQVYLEKLEEK